MRPVIVHYHLFKNAGTSLDRALKDAFGERWIELEGQDKRDLKPTELAEFLMSNQSVQALSSHTALLPPPTIPDTTVVAAVFIRHPLDRLRSAYDFERIQNADTLGALKAKETDLAGYIKWRLSRPDDHSARNFQTFRVAGGRDDLEGALRMLAEVPFVGLVEEFDRSVARLQETLAPHFPGVRLRAYRANVSADERTLEERLALLRERIGDQLYERLEESNRYDLALWEAVRARYASPPDNGDPGRDR